MKLIILGTSAEAFKEYQEAKRLFGECHVMAINFASLLVAGIDHIASLHSDYIKTYLDIAKIRNKEENIGGYIQTHSNKLGDSVNHKHDYKSGGTSGLFGLYVGLELKYDKIILCGISLDSNRFYGDNPQTYAHRHIRREWEVYQGNDKIRSMSGKTKNIFGYPTESWARGE